MKGLHICYSKHGQFLLILKHGRDIQNRDLKKKVCDLTRFEVAKLGVAST